MSNSVFEICSRRSEEAGLGNFETRCEMLEIVHAGHNHDRLARHCT
jgi:hypothetical protein